MSTPKRLPARERILDTACELFSAHGIRAVGVDRVIAESGVAKATLYSHFACKERLVAEYLLRSDRNWRGKLRSAALAAGPDPRDQLVGAFDALTAAYEEHGFRGCSFINAAAECEPGTEPQAIAATHKETVRSWLQGLATVAGAADPALLARQLTLLIDGALSADHLEQSGQAAAAARSAAAALVEQSCP
ncbi:TetR/AcrR family transcriptional regulator [Kitasatospora sp. McL0602]|uniref:TetR/AcrR family transcriptional regulator n=1 Tax=Kitasatospora sp. McL0602 TaxID=3439530 RepID=UPI003F8BD048